MLIPDHFKAELLNRTDIVDLARDRMELKRHGGEYVALCPSHDEKTPSFTISPSKQFGHCFGCGFHADAIDLVMELDGLGFREAVEYLAGRAGMEVPKDEVSEAKAKAVAKSAGALDKAVHRFGKALLRSERATTFLHSRGVEPQTVKDFAIGYSDLSGSGVRQLADEQSLIKAGLLSKTKDGSIPFFRDRITFPIRSHTGKVLSFAGRVIEGGEPKYLNGPNTDLFQKSEVVFGLYEAKQISPRPERLIVVEGYLDVTTMHQNNTDSGVSPMGTALTRRQAALLFRHTDSLVLCFDGDTAGRKAAWRALVNVLPEIKGGKSVSFVHLPEGYDPDSLIREKGVIQFDQEIDKALDLEDYLYEAAMRLGGGSSVSARATAIEAVRPAIASMPHSAFKELLLDSLAERFKVSSGVLIEAKVSRPAPPANQAKSHITEYTPAGRAITLLLSHPSVAVNEIDIDARELQDHKQSGEQLLGRLLEFMREQSSPLTAASILRSLENDHEIQTLRNLSAVTTEETAEQAVDALNEIGAKYTAERITKRVNDLLSKSRADGLVQSEHLELVALMRKRKEAQAPTM